MPHFNNINTSVSNIKGDNGLHSPKDGKIKAPFSGAHLARFQHINSTKAGKWSLPTFCSVFEAVAGGLKVGDAFQKARRLAEVIDPESGEVTFAGGEQIVHGVQFVVDSGGFEAAAKQAQIPALEGSLRHAKSLIDDLTTEKTALAARESELDAQEADKQKDIATLEKQIVALQTQLADEEKDCAGGSASACAKASRTKLDIADAEAQLRVAREALISLKSSNRVVKADVKAIDQQIAATETAVKGTEVKLKENREAVEQYIATQEAATGVAGELAEMYVDCDKPNLLDEEAIQEAKAMMEGAS